MKLFVCLASLLGIACSQASDVVELVETQHVEVSYSIRYKPDGLLTALEVKAEFDNAPSRFLLRVPNSWAGQDNLQDYIQGLSVFPKEADLFTTDDHPSIIEISQPTPGPVRLEYIVAQQMQEFSFADLDEAFFPPMLQNEYLHLVGGQFLIYPNLSKEQFMNVSIDWSLPEIWQIATSFGVQQTKQFFQATSKELYNGLFVLGNFRLIRSADLNVFYALRDKWQFSEQDLKKTVDSIIREQQKFFEDEAEFTLVSLLQQKDSSRGVALTNGFSMAFDRGCNLRQLAQLASHESLHRWIGGQISDEETGNEGVFAWFVEGFTDYYAKKFCVRADLLKVEEYVQEVNRTLLEFAQLSCHESPNEMIIKNFWQNLGIQKLPYLRGAVLAGNWNAEIQELSGGRYSLDDLMKSLRHEVWGKGRTLSNELIDEVGRTLVSKDFLSDISTYIDKGCTFAPHENSIGPCMNVKSEMVQTENGPRVLHSFQMDPLLWARQNGKRLKNLI